MQKMIKNTANESFYASAVWAISVFGAISVFLLLDAKFGWFFAVFFLFGVTAAMLVWTQVRTRDAVKSAGGKIYSFGRRPSQTLGDVCMKTIELSFISVLLDLAVKDVTVGKLFETLAVESIFQFQTPASVEAADQATRTVKNAGVESSWHPILTFIVLFIQTSLFLTVQFFVYSRLATRERNEDQ